MVGRLAGEMYDLHIGSSLVAWSDIGNLDFRSDIENTAGFAYMTWLGQIHQVKKLGNFVMIYGDGGVTKMEPHDRYWGFTNILLPGIKGKYAVCGDDNIHYFITQAGDLCSYTSSGRFEKLGYRRFLSALSTNVVMSLDSGRHEFFICDGTLGFHHTPEGLGETIPTITGVVNRYGDTLCVGSTENINDVFYGCLEYPAIPTTIFDRYSLIITDEIYGEGPGFKTLTAIRVEGRMNSTVYASIEYKYRDADDWSSTPIKVLNQEGSVYFGVTALCFRVKLWNMLTVEKLFYTIQHSDKRFIRSKLQARSDMV
jgi:hypothetical protein